MKKMYSFLAIVAILLVSNCSEIPENNDPVIGIWSHEEVQYTGKSSETHVRTEWIFNDAYLGRHHRYQNDELEVITDFSWKTVNGDYIISYPGLENKPDDIVHIAKHDKMELLEDNSGNSLAERE